MLITIMWTKKEAFAEEGWVMVNVRSDDYTSLCVIEGFAMQSGCSRLQTLCPT